MPARPHIPIPGPILYAREITERSVRLGLVTVTAEDEDAPDVAAPGGSVLGPDLLYRRFGAAVWGSEITLPAHPDAHYRVNGQSYPVLTELAGDCRVGFVSCNGREEGEDGWDEAERNVMWERLLAEHRASPIGLLLQGGDQIYADRVKFCHPRIREWAKTKAKKRPDIDVTEEMAATAERYMLHRYLHLFAMPQIGEMVAQVPSLMVWDDHDIFDGWGSHPGPVQDSPVGRTLFRIARRMFRMFQQGLPPDGVTPPGGFTHSLSLPGFSVVAPDLRSTRTRSQIMSEQAWAAFEQALTGLPDAEPLIIVSSTPALGPRLSWVEMLMRLVPRIQRYEDDLRDQWQSRAHREEWRRLLRLVESEAKRRPVTIVSGEIHLATRGEMALPEGRTVHQLVASGVAHPAPGKAYPRLLGLLATLGEAPLPGRPISLHPLPGRRMTYTRERNYLLLIRETGRWYAIWETEDQGPTDALALPP